MRKTDRKRSDVLDRIKAAVALKDNQSELYRWMVTNYADFSVIVGGSSRPGWRAIAAELQKAGIPRPGGDLIDATYARQTFWKVRRAMERRGLSPQKQIAAPVSAPVVPARLPAPERTPEPDEDFGLQFIGGRK